MSKKKYDDYDLRSGKNPYHWMLEMAGAVVLAFEKFGSYQGDWFAKVIYEDKVGWIRGGYGSCSSCDAWQSQTHYVERTILEWKQFCKDFAHSYLSDIQSYEEVFNYAKENLDWDLDAKEMVEWLEKNK